MNALRKPIAPGRDVGGHPLFLISDGGTVQHSFILADSSRFARTFVRASSVVDSSASAPWRDAKNFVTSTLVQEIADGLTQ